MNDRMIVQERAWCGMRKQSRFFLFSYFTYISKEMAFLPVDFWLKLIMYYMV